MLTADAAAAQAGLKGRQTLRLRGRGAEQGGGVLGARLVHDGQVSGSSYGFALVSVRLMNRSVSARQPVRKPHQAQAQSSPCPRMCSADTPHQVFRPCAMSDQPRSASGSIMPGL